MRTKITAQFILVFHKLKSTYIGHRLFQLNSFDYIVSQLGSNKKTMLAKLPWNSRNILEKHFWVVSFLKRLGPPGSLKKTPTGNRDR